jgi:rhodanese-related sulfurtransferase/SAM-dependent methyltransferase
LSSPATISARPGRHQDVTPEEALALVAAGACVLDVRSPAAFADEGHVPGALLLPMDRLAAAPAVVADDGRAILVVDGDGVRSRRAAAFLAEAGVARVHHLVGGLRGWPGVLDRRPSTPAGPSAWFLEHVRLAPRGARALDVACGRGRHALVLAQAGSLVRAVDRDAGRVAALREVARRLRLPVTAEVLDLEADGVTLGEAEYDLVLVFNYLHRPLFAALVRALAPGGLLLYETYTREHARSHGRPSRPEHLLDPGELPRLVEPLQLVGRREGETDGRHAAAVAARKPLRPSRSSATSHAAAARRVAATPAAQSEPARSRAAGSSGAARTPGARKR